MSTCGDHWQGPGDHGHAGGPGRPGAPPLTLFGALAIQDTRQSGVYQGGGIQVCFGVDSTYVVEALRPAPASHCWMPVHWSYLDFIM